MGVAGAILGAGALTAGAGIISSSNAADAQKKAAQGATDAQTGMFNQTQANLAPYMTAGGNALTALQKYIGVNGDGTFDPNAAGVKPFSLADFTASPGYKFQLDQGSKAIANSAAARGGVFSGNTLKALQQFGTGLADQDFWNAFNAYTNNQNSIFNKLQTISGSGQNAAANLGSLGTQVGGQIGGNIIGAGNASAAGTIGSANALAGGANSISQLAFLQSLLKGSGGGGGPAAGAAGTSAVGGFDSSFLGIG